jgi:PAS domain S-box-containing protein
MTAFEGAPRSGTVVIRGGRIVMASQGATALLGRTLEELQGIDFPELFAPEDRARIADRYERRMRGEAVPNDYEAAVLRADGTRATLELNVDREGPDVVVHYRDISLELERRARLLALAALGAAIQRERTEEAVLERLRTGLPQLGISPVLMRPGSQGVGVEWSRLPQAVEDAFVSATGRAVTGFAGSWSPFARKVWEEGAAFTDDWGTDAIGFAPEVLSTRARELAAAFQLERAVAVRLDERRGARFYLLLGSDWLRREDVAAVRLFAAQVAAALDAANAIADLSRRLSDLTAVHALTGRIFASPPGDVRALLQEGCSQAAAALGCEGAAAFLVEESGKVLRGVGLVGALLEAGHLRFAVEEDALALEAIRTGAPAWSPDVTRDPHSAMFGRTIPVPAMLAVPLVSRSATRGVLTFASRAGRVFSDAERALAMALAGELAVGLENAELYAAAQEQVRHLSLLGEMGRSLTSSLDLEQVLRAGAQAARRILDTDRAFIILYDAADGRLRLATGSGERAQELLERYRPTLEQSGLTARVLRARQTIAVEELEADPDVHPAHRAFGSRSVVAAPLLSRGEPLGVLFADSCRRRRFTETEQEQASAVAHQLAVAIENARLYAEARGRLSELSTVIDVARVVSSTLDLEEVLTAGAEHLKVTLRAQACTILLDDLQRQELRRAAHRGPPIGPEALPMGIRSLARDALEARAPVTGVLQGSPGDRPLLIVPLHVRDHPVGVALVAAEDPHRGFTASELSRAMAIASQLAVAVDNARLYQETRRRAEELGLLHEVGRSLVATLDIEEVLQAGVRNLARIVDAPIALLALTTPDGSALEFRAVWGGPQEILGRRPPLEPPGTLGALAFTRRQPLIVEDALSDPRIREDQRLMFGGRAYLVAPLLVRDHFVGTALIIETRGPRRFGPAEVDRATAVANQLAVAVENARLYEDLRCSYEKLAHAQRQLIEQERLAALGELSAVVAHEVRNPLGVIFNSLGSLRRMLQPEGDARVLLDMVGEEADRLNRIVGDLLDFARPVTPVLRPEPLERVVDEAVAAAVGEGSSVTVAREVGPDLPPVPMDARLVRQAVLNVAANAVQAMPRGGRLGVRICRDARGVLVELEDTGPGIPADIRTRIFEPFFTTKASGTGLGLAVVKRIMDGHRGEISVLTRPGGGTIVQLRFLVGLRAPGSIECDGGMG